MLSPASEESFLVYQTFSLFPQQIVQKMISHARLKEYQNQAPRLNMQF